MSKIFNYELRDFNRDVEILTTMIKDRMKGDDSPYTSIYPIPRGGIPLAMELSKRLRLPIIELHMIDPTTLIVDDLIDTGRTIKPFKIRELDTVVIHVNPNSDVKPEFFVQKKDPTIWIEYWWEKNEAPAEDAVIRLIELIGEDMKRQGLKDTPKRYIKAIQFLTSGYGQNIDDIMTTFDADGYDQIILLKDIEMYSLCEHHMLPFFGKVHIAYIPNENIIGISKLARLVDVFSKRLQIQERIGDEVTTALMDHLQPLGVACIIEATHLCMRMRGVQKQNSTMVTSSLKGIFLENSTKGFAARNELMKLTHG